MRAHTRSRTVLTHTVREACDDCGCTFEVVPRDPLIYTSDVSRSWGKIVVGGLPNVHVAELPALDPTCSRPVLDHRSECDQQRWSEVAMTSLILEHK